ncbi:MAG: GNAT family N-acetyltransferase [Pseudonocardiaceae bacterium]
MPTLLTVQTVLRRATHDDLPAITLVDGRAFGVRHSEQDIADVRPMFEPDRFLLACDADDGQIVGVTGDFPFTMTLPGGGALAVPGVTFVAVATTHRRRGVLRTMMAAQHRGFIEDGVAVSILTASEGGIYGRFGYGPATISRVVEIDRWLTAFRPGAPIPVGYGRSRRTRPAALGSMYLGGHRAATLARSGFVQIDNPDMLRRVDAAFTADRSPRYGTEF